MSSTNGTNDTLVVILTGTAFAYTLHHTYKFDQCRCLVPTRREWFRALLAWMIIFQTCAWFTWAAGWAYVKYKLGYEFIPGYGFMPVPSTLWPSKYAAFNTPLTICCVMAYTLTVSLNAEEGLYWWHLMRAVRRPASARAWLRSPYFAAWLAISAAAAVVNFITAFAGKVDDNTQLARVFICGGVLEAIVLAASSVVMWTFPAFLKEVASGAGPEVRARLHLFHEANKVRNFFRLVFAAAVLTLGVDGVTAAQRVNRNHIASDLLQQISFSAFFFTSVISITLYLPRNWGATPRRARVLVGVARPAPPPAHAASTHALMTLLREAGQWDGEGEGEGEGGGEGELAGAYAAYPAALEGHAPFGARADTWDTDKGEAPLASPGKATHDLEAGVPSVLNDFISPWSVRARESVPPELRVRVEHEVFDDREDGEERDGRDAGMAYGQPI